MEHINIGMDVVNRAIEDLSGVGRPTTNPNLQWQVYHGKFISTSSKP